MKQGVLIYDEKTGRYDIRFSLEEYYGGLHCGETFDVYVNGKCKPARIEMDNDWYLVGIQTKSDRFSVVLVFPATRSFKYWEKCKQVADSTVINLIIAFFMVMDQPRHLMEKFYIGIINMILIK